MKIESLKQLKELISMCQKLGVTDIQIDGISISLGATLAKQRKAKRTTRTIYGPSGAVDVPVDALPDDIATPDTLTDEQLLMWSAAEGGVQSSDGAQ